MASFIGALRRNWMIFNPPQPAKTSDALRIGLLGASNIGPMAIITPAKSHPEVIIAAVAARDVKKATAYAKKHDIPIVHKSYQELIDDPSIDIIYNPLPNGLHYEWTLKILKAGKHVLLEKPSVSNASEAESLFRHPLLSAPNAPILLEAFHPRFYPGYQKFLSLVDPPNIVEASASMHLFKGMFPLDDIRIVYDLSGGTLMDMGTYMVLALRHMLASEPRSCVSANATLMPPGFDQKCDRAMKATWQWENGATGSIDADLSATGGYWFPWLTSWLPTFELPKARAVHREAVVPDGQIGEGEEHVIVKTVTMFNFMGPHMWHRIDVLEEHSVREKESRKVVKAWSEKKSLKKYKWEQGEGKRGEEWWTTYRYQLEQFIDRVKGRKGAGDWMEGEESIKQMRMIDSAYLKAGMDLRPTSSFTL